MDNFWVAAAWSLIPTVVVLGLLIYMLRGIVHMDRNERRMYAKVEAEERAKRGLAPKAPAAERAGAPAGPTASAPPAASR